MLRTVRDFQAFTDAYDPWDETTDKSTYAKFRRCLKGDSKDAWNIMIDGESQTELEFVNYLTDWIEGKIGITAYKVQVKYLKKTPKPSNLDTKKWTKKIRSINTFLKLMSQNAVKLTDTELLEHVILENIPTRWKQECDFKGIDEESWKTSQRVGNKNAISKESMKISNGVKCKLSYSPMRNTSHPPMDIQDLPSGTQETIELQETI